MPPRRASGTARVRVATVDPTDADAALPYRHAVLDGDPARAAAAACRAVLAAAR